MMKLPGRFILHYAIDLGLRNLTIFGQWIVAKRNMLNGEEEDLPKVGSVLADIMTPNSTNEI